MSNDNPYKAPEASVEGLHAPIGPARLWRIPLWAALIFIFVFLIHAVGQSLLRTWSPNQDDIRAMLKIGGLLLSLAASAVAYVLYLVFLHGVGRYVFMQVLGVFVLLQLMISMLLMFVLPSGNFPMSLVDLAWNLGVCLLAYATWRFNPRRLRKLYHPR